jgi:hypothetical protein
VVTTVDGFHHEYIIGLTAHDVMTEKPLTTTTEYRAS